MASLRPLFEAVQVEDMRAMGNLANLQVSRVQALQANGTNADVVQFLWCGRRKGGHLPIDSVAIQQVSDGQIEALNMRND